MSRQIYSRLFGKIRCNIKDNGTFVLEDRDNFTIIYGTGVIVKSLNRFEYSARDGKKIPKIISDWILNKIPQTPFPQ